MQIERTMHAATPVQSGGSTRHHGIWSPGIRLFRNLNFASKALLVSAAFVLPVLCLLAWFLVSQGEQEMSARMDATRQHVEVALGAVEFARARESSGELSRADAQKLAKETLAKMRYNKTDYFFVFDMQPVMLMHPIKPELVGTDVGPLQDSNGTAMWRAMADVVRKQDSGFVNYLWPKPGSDEPVAKISYAQGFKPWGWVVGSGVYVDDLRAAIRQRLLLAIGVFVLMMLLTSYLFYCFYRVINDGLKETGRHLRAMTGGDLTTRLNPSGKDETAQLMWELRSMQDSLRSIVARVRGSSAAIVDASSEIASSSKELSQRTEHAAASLQQSASSMAQMSSTARHASDNVREAAQVASGNSRSASRGGKVIGEVISTMQEINDSSKRIGDIIGVIDGLAFQTNILALNAAVEAARAGEQGRGFAVVAGEVRSLAHRSATAAKEIKTLIATSVERVDAGTKIVQGAGESMQEMVTNAVQMNRLLDEISIAAAGQSEGVSQMGTAVSELDRMTQQNAALVDKTAGSASTLKLQAEQLATQVDNFKLP